MKQHSRSQQPSDTRETGARGKDTPLNQNLSDGSWSLKAAVLGVSLVCVVGCAESSLEQWEPEQRAETGGDEIAPPLDTDLNDGPGEDGVGDTLDEPDFEPRDADLDAADIGEDPSADPMPDVPSDSDDSRDFTISDYTPFEEGVDSSEDGCPAGMVLIEDFCMSRYEAPLEEGSLPFVMFTFTESARWCETRGYRLCFDDEWTRVCGGTRNMSYPYGDTHEAGVCNDEETWRTYNQTLLNGWPRAASVTTVESFAQQLSIARGLGGAAADAADHIEALYQAEAAGSNEGCQSVEGVFDLCGNVEEWTRRRDGGAPDFHGALKGRYWAETRTCQNAVITHGDAFRFYEIGFRCCADPL